MTFWMESSRSHTIHWLSSFSLACFQSCRGAASFLRALVRALSRAGRKALFCPNLLLSSRCLNVCGSEGERTPCSLKVQLGMLVPVSPSKGTLPWRGAPPFPLVMGGYWPLSVLSFNPLVAPLVAVPFRLLLSVNLLGFFPPPGVCGSLLSRRAGSLGPWPSFYQRGV